MHRRPFGWVVVGGFIAAAPPLLCQSPGSSGHTYVAHVLPGCTLTFDYASNETTERQLMNSDREGVGFLIYTVYSSSHNEHADLVAAAEQERHNRNTVAHMPVLTTEGPARRPAKKPTAPHTSNGVRIGQDTLDIANGYMKAFALFSPDIQLHASRASLYCSETAIDQMQNAALNRQEHVERALTFIADPDPALQQRGLRTLNSEADVGYLWALPSAQRQQLADAAYRLYTAEFSALVNRQPSMSYEFVGVEMLEKLHDQRTVDAYWEYVLAEAPMGASTIALKALATMLPRPTQILPRLEALIATHETDTRPAWHSFYDTAFATLFLVGREEARPIFERLVRSRNEYIAGLAESAIDGLNNLRRDSERVDQ